MAPRKKKEKKGGGGASWLVTFADLTTLLLTFFVLILTMCSMDQSVITQVNIYTRTIGHVSPRAAGKVPQRIELVIALLEDPLAILDKPNRFKDLLFPEDIIPPEIDRNTLMENITVLQRPEGVALVLTDGLLFQPGDARITPPARALLENVALMLLYMSAPVNVAGHTGPQDAMAGSQDPYDLSMKRAENVLALLLEAQVRQERFSLSCYGDDRPVDPTLADAPVLSQSRVEILVKTTPFFRGY